MERHLTTAEKGLVRALIDRAQGFAIAAEWFDQVQVTPMDDGGMGSLRFLPSSPGQTFGDEIAEVVFQDADGVVVSATLNLDEAGVPFELDIWKVDGNSLIRIPDQFPA